MACGKKGLIMGFRVLIVDDSPAMRAVVRRVLDMSGFPLQECFEARHGGEALRIMLRNRVDVVLTDVNMPVMNGEQFLVRIREHDPFSRIPVVVVSTDASRNRMQRMFELGASGYLTKPFFPEALRTEIERVLEAQNA